MSHAAPSCAGFAPRHITFGVTTQKFGIGEPRSSAHPAGAAGIDEDGKPPIRSANKKESALFKDDVPHRRERVRFESLGGRPQANYQALLAGACALQEGIFVVQRLPGEIHLRHRPVGLPRYVEVSMRVPPPLVGSSGTRSP